MTFSFLIDHFTYFTPVIYIKSVFRVPNQKKKKKKKKKLHNQPNWSKNIKNKVPRRMYFEKNMCSKISFPT